MSAHARPTQGLAALLAVFALAGPAAAGKKESEDVLALTQRVQGLEERLAQIEAAIDKLRTVGEQAAQATPPPAPAAPAMKPVDPTMDLELETRAQYAYGEIQKLLRNGEFGAAHEATLAFMKDYGTTVLATKTAKQELQTLLIVGSPVPENWGIQKWFQGEEQVDLASGKPTLVVFWEVWCPACRAEVPKVEKLYTDLKDQGLQVVGLTRVSKTATEAAVTAFITEKQLGYPIARIDGSLGSYLNVSTIPAAALFKDGVVVWRGHPAGVNAAMLKKLL